MSEDKLPNEVQTEESGAKKEQKRFLEWRSKSGKRPQDMSYMELGVHVPEERAEGAPPVSGKQRIILIVIAVLLLLVFLGFKLFGASGQDDPETYTGVELVGTLADKNVRFFMLYEDASEEPVYTECVVYFSEYTAAFDPDGKEIDAYLIPNNTRARVILDPDYFDDSAGAWQGRALAIYVLSYAEAE